MFEPLQQKFKNLLGRFSYRQRFIFWVVIVFLVTPLPTYWILSTQYSFSSRAQLQLRGSREVRVWLTVFDALINNYSEWTCKVASGEGNSHELETLKRTFMEAWNILENDFFVEKKEMIIWHGLFHQGNIIKNNKEDSEFLKELWEKISHEADSGDMKAHETLYREAIAQLKEKIHGIAYDFHLILHTDKKMQMLSESIYFSFLRDQILLIDLSEIIANLTIVEESPTAAIDRAKDVLSNVKGHFQQTKERLERVYQELENSSIWKEFSYDETIERLSNCSQLDLKLINTVTENLLLVENQKKPWPGTHSLFAKNGYCLEKSRNIANDIFDHLLIKEHYFYFWQQAIVIFALLFFVFLMFVFVFFRFLSSHFTQMSRYIQGVSKGNFCNKMNTNPNEEMGQIAIAFEKMGKSIEEVADKLKSLGLRLAESSEEIGLTAHEQANAVAIQRKCLTSLDSDLKQISSKSRELANTMDAFMQMSRDRVEKDESNKRLEHLGETIALLKNASFDILGIFSGVYEKGLNTRKLTTHMTKISDQASLLALNAAIESLNVGSLESFDDITEKIQHFAFTTSSSTLTIQKIVNEMCQSVVLGKVTTESCIKEITHSANRLIEVGSQLQIITNQDAIQNVTFHLVNTMIQNQAQRSEGIIEAAATLNVISGENTQAVEMLYETISQLAVFSKDLHSLIHALFIQGMKENEE